MNRFARTLRKIGWNRNGLVTVRPTTDPVRHDGPSDVFCDLDELADAQSTFEIDRMIDLGAGWAV